MEKSNKKASYSQLTKLDRNFIEISIAKNESLKQIAKSLNRGTSTITNEILNNRIKLDSTHVSDNDCIYAADCNRTNLCGNMDCPFQCKWCRKQNEFGPCTKHCKEYHSNQCSLLLRPPYVCNTCHLKDRCIKEKFIYNANKADEQAVQRRKHAHFGPRLSSNQIVSIDNLLQKLLKRQGQSIAHITRTHAEEIGVSVSSLYNYIRKGYLETRLIDLRRAAAMSARRRIKKNSEIRRDRSYKIGRTYANYCEYILENTEDMICEMDTVEGKKSESKRILTILIKRYSILLIFLLPNGKAASVSNVFNYLSHKLGIDKFRKIFPVILTDNGAEFQQVEGIELSPENEIRTCLFFCDPNRSDQKGSIERAHEFIRYVLPKGSSFERLDQEDFTLLMNHINSYYRASINNHCPYDLIDEDDEPMHDLMQLLHLKKIPADEVNLTPSLLKNKHRGSCH